MFHYFLQDHTGFLRVGYIASYSKEAAQELLERAHIRELFGLTQLPEEAVPKGARYMYPFEGKWHGKHVQGTVEGETLLSALEHLIKVFDGTVEIISERAPTTPEERSLYAMQTTAFLSSMAPKPAPTMEVSVSAAVSTVLDRQFFETMTQIRNKTKDLLHERQFADEIKEMHRIMFSLEQQRDLGLKEKYDALSYILRELSYIQDGLDPSPLKKEMGQQIDNVVNLLKKVEKSMVRTAFHLDNVRIHQDLADQLPEEVSMAMPEEAMSRYASRKRLVAEVMLGIRALQSGKGTMAMAGATMASTPLPVHLSEGHDHIEPETEHASEPLSHLLLRELPMLLEWFVGFSLVIIILGQIVQAMDAPLILGEYDLGKILAPFAWQHVFLKTTLLATIALIGLRAYEAFVPLWRWLTMVVLFIGVALVFLVL